MKNSLKTTGTVCLAAGLVSTWDSGFAQSYPFGSSPASPISFNGEITPTHDLTAVYFLFAAGPCAPGYSKKIADFVPANTTTAFSLTINSIYAYGDFVEAGDHFSVIGLYDAANGGVSLGLAPATGSNILAQSPAPNFNGSWTLGYGSTSDESLVASRLQSGMYNGLTLDDANNGGLVDPNAGLYNYFDPVPGGYYSTISTDLTAPSPFTLVDFSSASPGGGGFVVEVVPEPTAAAGLTMGSALLTLHRLRRRK